MTSEQVYLVSVEAFGRISVDRYLATSEVDAAEQAQRRAGLRVVARLAHTQQQHGEQSCAECGRPVVWDDTAGDYRHTTGSACALALAATNHEEGAQP